MKTGEPMEKYEDIIEEIKELGKVDFPLIKYKENHEISCDEYGCNGVALVLDVARRVCAAVGGDPNQWYLLDENGERIYVGDKVRDNHGTVYTVAYFMKIDSETWAMRFEEGGWLTPDDVSKFVPDTQEKIDADAELSAMAYCLLYGLESTYEGETTSILKTRHILARQRELDGVENA